MFNSGAQTAISRKSTSRNRPVMVAVSDESIAGQLQIDENTWFEEIATIEGIFLKISGRPDLGIT